MPRARLRTCAVVACVLACVGCYQSASVLDRDDAGVDAGASLSLDAGPGTATDVGAVDASRDAGTGTTVDAARAPCTPMGVSAGPPGGSCVPQGWYWAGSCRHLIACTCVGPDCGALYPTSADCQRANASCESTCENDDDCLGAERCVGPCDAPSWGRVCRGAPTDCASYPFPVCGCDGTSYPSECDANAAGVTEFLRACE